MVEPADKIRDEFSSRRTKVEFVSLLIEALRNCSEDDSYDVVIDLIKSTLSDATDINLEYLSIHLPFFGDDSEVENWENWRRDLIKKAALAGVSEAQYEYGLYEIERENFDRSFELFQKSARFGYPPALYSVGWAYFYGQGVEKDEARGVDFIELAAGRQYIIAIEFLINYYKNKPAKREKYEMMLSWAKHDLPDVY